MGDERKGKRVKKKTKKNNKRKRRRIHIYVKTTI